MVLPRQLPPGKRVASLDKTSLSSPTGRCVVQQGNGFGLMNSAEKPMAACVSCMGQASAAVVLVPCATSVNGMAVLQANRARSACSCIRSGLGVNRSSGVTGVVGPIDGHACNCFVT